MAQVLPEALFIGYLESIILKDYFPNLRTLRVQAGLPAPPELPPELAHLSLDDYLERFTSDDNASYLRLVGDDRPRLLSAVRKRLDIVPANTRFGDGERALHRRRRPSTSSSAASSTGSVYGGGPTYRMVVPPRIGTLKRPRRQVSQLRAAYTPKTGGSGRTPETPRLPSSTPGTADVRLRLAGGSSKGKVKKEPSG